MVTLIDAAITRQHLTRRLLGRLGDALARDSLIERDFSKSAHL
jgi:hypothetical protein